MPPAPRFRRSMFVGSALLTLSSCIAVPLPAEKESTPYDSLTDLAPGTTAVELESRYGPPDLKCDDDRLWIYGWTVGHGGVVWMVGGLGGGADRFYTSFHVAFLWFDSGERLVRIDAPDAVEKFTGDATARICTVEGTCVRPLWNQRLESTDQSWACSSIQCVNLYLAPDSTVESRGRVVNCRRVSKESQPISNTPDDAPR